MSKFCRICHNTDCSNHGRDITFLGDGFKCNYIPVPTNADRIRAMTDEELADILREFVVKPMQGSFLKWLKQPVEE